MKGQQKLPAAFRSAAEQLSGGSSVSPPPNTQALKEYQRWERDHGVVFRFNMPRPGENEAARRKRELGNANTLRKAANKAGVKLPDGRRNNEYTSRRSFTPGGLPYDSPQWNGEGSPAQYDRDRIAALKTVNISRARAERPQIHEAPPVGGDDEAQHNRQDGAEGGEEGDDEAQPTPVNRPTPPSCPFFTSSPPPSREWGFVRNMEVAMALLERRSCAVCSEK